MNIRIHVYRDIKISGYPGSPNTNVHLTVRIGIKITLAGFRLILDSGKVFCILFFIYFLKYFWHGRLTSQINVLRFCFDKIFVFKKS